MSLSGKYAALGMTALLALQLLWHVFLLPPERSSAWLVAALFCLPLLPGLLLLIARKPSAIFWGGVAALFYFCHGIVEAWTVADSRPLALCEIALAIWTIVAGSWLGMKARFSRPKTPSANV